MQSLVDNLSLFNYRELLVRALCWHPSWQLCRSAVDTVTHQERQSGGMWSLRSAWQPAQDVQL